MKYQSTQTVDAFVVTAVSYTLDDGSTKPATPDTAAIGGYWVRHTDGSEGFVGKAQFEAEFTPAPLAD